MDIKMLLGRKIKEYRNKIGLTQAQLAEIVNVDNKHISCIENGKNFPSADLLGRLAKAFNTEPKNLFEFYHLQNISDLKNGIISMLEHLSEEELCLTYKYIRTFII